MAVPTGAILQKETIKLIAEQIGISDLPDDVALQAVSDVEYRMRELTQEALKFMKHSKRERLTPEDFNAALRLRNMEQLYGYNSKDALRYVRTASHRDLFYLDDKDLDVEAIVNDYKLPPCPRQVSFACHWLAIDGVQPEIPQNPPKRRKTDTTSEQAPTQEVQPAVNVAEPVSAAKMAEEIESAQTQVRHVLTKELQAFFEKITEAILGNETTTLQAALNSLRSDPGLHQLLPFFCKFISDKVTENLHNLRSLLSLMKTVDALLTNPHIHVDHYLHQIIPPVLTCIVGRRLCESATENHWDLREFAAKLISFICYRFGRQYSTIQPRVIKTLVHAFVDVKKPLTTHFGAIIGLTRLGQQTRQLLILPQLPGYFKLLEQALAAESPVKRAEATMVYGALQTAAGLFLYDSSRMYAESASLLAKINGTSEATSSSSSASSKAAPGIASEHQAVTADGSASAAAESTTQPTLAGATTSDGMDVEGGAAKQPSAATPNGDATTTTIASPTSRPKSHKPSRLEADDLVPLGTFYPQLFDIFGESVFPYLVRRTDDPYAMLSM